MSTGVFASVRLYRWVGHVARMGQERNASRIVVGRAQGEIQLWKRRSTWLFSVALRPNAGHGLLILEVSRSHTATHHIRWDSSGPVISSSQRPLPDNTQHPQQTFMPPAGFEPTISTGERPQTYTLDRTATGTGRRTW